MSAFTATIYLNNSAPVNAKDFERIRDEISGHVLADPLPRETTPGSVRWKFKTKQGWAVTCDGSDSAVASMLAKLKPYRHPRTDAAWLWVANPGITTPAANTRTYTEKQYLAALERTPELAGLVVEPEADKVAA